MTCIVALKENGKVYIGGDCAGSDQSFTHSRKDPKVFKRGKFLIGFTSSFRMGQLLMHTLKVDPQSSIECIGATIQTDYQFMCTTFVNADRECLKKGG